MNNKILLPQLVGLLATAAGISKKQAESFLKAFFSTATRGVVAHENVKIKGFGTFKVSKVEARKSVNVSTGKAVEIPAHYKLVFVPSKSMAEKVNQDFAWLEIVEISDNLSNEELNQVDENTKFSHRTGEPSSKTETSVQKGETDGNKSIEREKNVDESTVIIPQESVASSKAASSKETIVTETEAVLPQQETELIGKESEKTLPTDVASTDTDSPRERGSATAKEEVTSDTQPETSENIIIVPDKTEKDIAEGGVDNKEESIEKSEKEFVPAPPVVSYNPNQHNSPTYEQPIPEDKFVTREEFEKFASKKNEGGGASKEELLITKRAIKSLKKEVTEVKEKSGSSVIKAVWISLLVTIILMIGGFIALYYILNNKIQNAGNANIEKIEENDNILENEDAIVSNVSNSTINEVPQKNANSDKEEDNLQKTDNSSGIKDKSSSTATTTENAAATAPSDTQKKYDTVTTTRYLTTISREHYGNYHFWPYIYLENESILGHPDRIKPGTKVVVPSLSKYGVDPKSKSDIEKAKKLGVEIYKKYSK